MNDYLVKVISESGSLRAFACVTTGLVNEAYNRQKPAEISGMMLGRVLSGMALLGGTVKQRERISLRFEGNGPIERIIAESDAEGNIHGSAINLDVGFDEDRDIHEQIRTSIGTAGVLTVTKDLGLKQPYSGSVHLVSGEVGEDIAYYLTESEQIPSAVAVSTLPSTDGSGVEIAGGYLIQAMPSEGGIAATDDANLESINQMIKSLPPLSELLKRGNTPENIISKLFMEVPYKQIDIVPLQFKCSCSHDVLRKALKSVGNKQIQSLIDDKVDAVLTCQFCKKDYSFTQGELKQVLAGN